MKRTWLPCIAWWMLLFSSCGSGQPHAGQEWSVVAVSITDGDTFVARGNGKTFKVRLQGIDAPERGQDFSKRSKERLGELCMASPLKIKFLNKDGFGRWVAEVYDKAGRHINAEMVASGLAWHFKMYSQDPELDRLEQQARKAGLGLWSLPNPQAPWDYRSSRRSGSKVR